ncbi:efflux RND transporter periplasmic adaptor subunit [Glaciecola sp. SC05]|uniref:efflux RND transporter periplasmic adaptor subunit n=1 Tax=Glaciecola sp. SC05 TaxID=1987355 RepID=UPI0035280525
MAQSSIKKVLLGTAIGVTLGVGVTLTYTAFNHGSHSSLHGNGSLNAAKDANEPLYWVAPMDPNFRRDAPGKSPMGMDLVPVYANQNNDDSPGTVTISANIENNLGVKTTMARLMVLDSMIHTVGIVRYNEDTLVHIHPRVEGWIEQLFVKATGDYVEKGAPLYSLYSPELVNAQEEYLLALQRSNSNLIRAAKSRLTALQVPESAITRLSETRSVQQNLTFTAPQTGFVDNLNVRQGFFVQPSNTLMSIGALDEVWVDVDIFARDAAQLALEQTVDMRVDYAPGQQWQGNIDYIYPSLDSSTRTVKARVRFDNPDYQLKPNMYASVSIHSNQDKDAIVPQRHLVVPSQAVIRTGRQNRVVLAKGEGKFKSIEVSLGRIEGDYIEILSGLRAGDKVVTSAQFLLDSESSINSDFMRMLPPAEMPVTVWTEAQVNSIMLSERKLNLSHGELSAWNMGAMTMDFMVAEAVDMTSLTEGMNIHVEITRLPTGMYQVNTVHIMKGDHADGHEHGAHESMLMDMSADEHMHHMQMNDDEMMENMQMDNMQKNDMQMDQAMQKPAHKHHKGASDL